jgi:hypothetical protein
MATLASEKGAVKANFASRSRVMVKEVATKSNRLLSRPGKILEMEYPAEPLSPG